MASPSARRWLGVGAALSGLPAAGGCFCAAPLLALVADSEPGAVYERAWWLGAAVVTGAVCAFAAMVGGPNLREAAPPPVPAPTGTERFVRDYYTSLDGRRFGAAWRMLAPGLRSDFGDFARWRRGYARTVANTLSGLRVRPAGATVGLTLRAGDRGACGKTVVRRFAVTWQLACTDGGWRATAAAARALSGATPAAVC